MNINGILILNKQVEITSRQSVSVIKRVFKVKKAGHAGTLDPFATGVLPVFLGKATKIAQFISGDPKSYRATLQLGRKTDTLDLTGEVIAEKSIPKLTLSQIKKVSQEFIGETEQIPPMFSAIKVKGQPLYKAARQGKTVERKSRKINIHRFEINSYSKGKISFTVDCNPGTYIRVLAEDLAERLGTMGHLISLERTGSGGFLIDHSVTLTEIKNSANPEEFEKKIISINQALSFIPQVVLTDNAARAVLFGQPFTSHDLVELPAKSGWETQKKVRVMTTDNELIALAHIPQVENSGSLYRLLRVFENPKP